MQKQNFPIMGMTCAACAKNIERVTGKLNGVTSSTVNFSTEKLIIEYDETKINSELIKETVSKAGYELIEEIKDKEITIPIQGMTCASCASRIEKVVLKLDGVSQASVNFATEKLTTKYNPQKVRISQIKQTIIKAGYKPQEIETRAIVDEDKLKKEKEIKNLWIKFIISAVFSIPLLYLI